jgi:hypothetical protein
VLTAEGDSLTAEGDSLTACSCDRLVPKSRRAR